MPKQKVILDQTAIDKFPNIHVFLIAINGLSKIVRNYDAKSINLSLEDLPETIIDCPELYYWRCAFKDMNLKPSKYHSSVESLLRRARKNGEDWLTGIPAVDFYNSYSIKYRSTLGGYDLSKMPEEPLTIRTVDPLQDYFDPIGAESSKFKLSPEQVSYMIGNEVACWCLNHRDSKNYCLDNNTDIALFCSESISVEQYSASFKSLKDIEKQIMRNGGLSSGIKILNVEFPEIEITYL